MGIEIVTKKEGSWPKSVLESNAKELIVKILEEYEADHHETGLVKNIIETIKGNNNEMHT